MGRIFCFASLCIAIIGYYFANNKGSQKIDVYIKQTFIPASSSINFVDFKACDKQVQDATDEQLEVFINNHINAYRKDFFETIKTCLIKLNKDPRILDRVNILIHRFDRF